MIRWKFLLPRLLILALLLLMMHYGTGPLLRLLAIRGGQMSLKSQVELGPIKASLLSGQVHIRGSQVADPGKPMQNLVEFASSELQLDPQALMRKRFVIERGQTSGLRFGTPRKVSGSLQDGSAQDQAAGQLAEKVGELGGMWLSAVGDRLQTQLEEDLHSVKLARELSERWPAEYGRLEERVQTWRNRVELLRQTFDAPSNDPLQMAQQYQQGIGDIERILQELPALKQEVLRLRSQAEQDRVALDAARRHDAEYLKRKMQIENLDQQELTRFLIGDEMQSRISQLTGWLSRGRQFAAPGSQGPAIATALGRGRVFSLEPSPEPSFLIRKLGLDGQLDLNGKAYGFVGFAQDVTHRPQQLGRPAVVQLKGTGDAEFDLQLVLDYTKKDKTETLRFRCPKLPQPARQLGKPEQLAVDVSSGHADVWVELDRVDDELKGTVSLQQPDVSLVPRVATTLGGEKLQQRLESVFADLNGLKLQLQLDGPVTRPDWKVESNIGHQLSRGLNQAVAAELSERAAELQAEANALVQQYASRFESLAGDQQTVLQDKLQIGEQAVQQLRQRLSSRLGLPGGAAGSLFDRLRGR